MADAPRRFWLMKTEPTTFSIQDLRKHRVSHWEGVRNYQARNLMRDEMKPGDLVLIYHSNSNPSGVAGVGRVCREAYPDFTAWDPESLYFDPKTSPDNPRWIMVDIEFVEEFPQVISLETLKTCPNLEGMMVTKKGMRLSVQPVEKAHFDRVLKLAKV